MKWAWVLALSLFGLQAKAQIKYPFSDIPAELKAKARSVIRTYEVITEVKDFSQVSYRVKKAVTVLNKNGDQDVRLALFYDKNNRIGYVKGQVYNEPGLPVGKITEKNFEDVSAVDGFSLYTDDRVKRFSPGISTYPYTVEYEYEMRFRHTMYFPVWYPVSSAGVSVQQASYTFLCKPDFKVRNKLQNYAGKAEEGLQGDYRSYNFSVQNKPAFRDEPYSSDEDAYLTAVYFAPEKFTYAGLNGQMSNWNEYGKWFYDKLISGRDQLSPQTTQRVEQLVSGIKDPKEKVRKIYQWMQQRSRYVSVQIGIGGLQPIAAAEVDGMSYGDCKGLVNYTKALLKAAGIPSWYTLVSAGTEKHSFPAGFTSMNGNHVILCVPLKNDTTWLECTSKNIPFGFLSDFTDDRNVLACTPEGGKLMHTPIYKPAQNKQLRNIDVRMDTTGRVYGTIKTLYEGVQVDNLEYLTDEAPTEQRKLMTKRYSINNFNINRFTVETDTKALARKTETIDFAAENFASFNEGRLYFIPNMANRLKNVPAEIRNRTQQVCIQRGYEDDDRIVYQLPAGYKPEYLPEPVSVKNAFGEYHSSLSFAGGKLEYKRLVKLNEVTRPADEYATFLELYQAMYDADNRSLTLVKE